MTPKKAYSIDHWSFKVHDIVNAWHHDTQQNNTQHNDIQHSYKQNVTLGILTELCYAEYHKKPSMLCVVMPSVVMNAYTDYFRSAA